MLRILLTAALSLAAILLLSCTAAKTPSSEPPAKAIGAILEIKAPLGLPPVPVPADNPPTAAAVALGRRLYYDTILSRDHTISCASCHRPDAGFADPRKVSAGVGGKLGTRNAPTVLNAAYAALQFWDGRSPSLEEQAAGPIANPVEMDQPHTPLIEKLNGIALYHNLFAQAYGPGPVTLDKLKKAIASFERTILSGNSAFDRYQYGGDKKAMPEAAIRGLALFTDKTKANCAVCHTIEQNYALFTDGKFHNLGVGMDEQGNLRDLGRFEQTKTESDKGAFKTPTLRDIAKTAPYMHDGSQRTLRDVVDFYVGGGNSNPQLDKEIRELKLNQHDRADLVAFLEALTGEAPAGTGPLRGE